MDTWAAARKAVESTYRGQVTVTEYVGIEDDATKITNFSEVATLPGQPCLLSFERLQPVAQGEAAAMMVQRAKLFIAADISIRPGSKITVTQDGVTTEYSYSGVPAVYPTHQEILLDLFEEWA